MPKKLNSFPRRHRGRTGMDWSPYLNGDVWQFEMSELPYADINTAAAGFRRKAESCGMKPKTMTSNAKGMLIVQALEAE